MYSTDKKLKNNKMEADIKKYRIVCEYPSDQWTVQEQNELYGNPISVVVHICELKGKEGYEEAKQWIEKQEE